MDMKQLTTFMTLAKTLNYQKAADQLQYAPSTLFKHIQLLEQELGVELFFKQGRQLCLTAEGQTFEKHAANILTSYRNAIQSIAACNVQESSLTIGGCEINTGNSLLRLFNQFSRTYPKAHMSMLTSPNANVPQLVKNSMIDLGFFFSIDGKNLPGLEMVPLYREPVYLLTGHDNPIFEKDGLRYEDLQDMAFAYPHDSCCFICELLSLLRRKGVALGKVTYLGNLLLVAEQIHKEHAVTLMPHSAVEHFCSTYDMKVIDLGEPVIWTWNTLVYKNFDSLNPLARALLRQSTEYAQCLLREERALTGEQLTQPFEASQFLNG